VFQHGVAAGTGGSFAATETCRQTFGTRRNARRLVERYRQASIKIIPTEIVLPENLRDADDLHVLGCAVAARADAIVSGDQDLLVLRSFANIPILTSVEVLGRLPAK
jgi:uncharacterized protein